MLYPHSFKEESFDFFTSFVKNLINGNETYRQLVTPVIKDAKDVASGTKEYFQIQRNTFDIVMYLVENDREFFKKIDVASLDFDDLGKILRLLTKQRELIFA